MNWKEQNLKCW